MADSSISDRDQLVLHALRLRGLAPVETVAAASGLDTHEVERRLTDLAASGLVRHRATGRMPGWALTAGGKKEHAERVLAPSAEVEAGYTAFLPHNTAFKAVCTDWQLRDGTTNDHADPEYDAAIVERLGALHNDIRKVTDGIAAEVPRFGTYGPRFEAALNRVRAGELAAFARPLADSYHDVWMELHQDLLLTLGRERGDDDGH